MYLSHETCINGETFKREIGGDKAYPYINKPEGWGIRITKSGEETWNLDKEGEEVGEKAKNAQLKDVVFDPAIARLQGVVKQTIQQIKCWPIFQQPSHCNNLMWTYKMILFSAALMNWFLEKCNIKQI